MEPAIINHNPSPSQPDNQQPLQSEDLAPVVLSKLKDALMTIQAIQNKREGYTDAVVSSDEAKEAADKLLTALNTAYSHFLFLIKVLESPFEDSVAILKDEFLPISEAYTNLNKGSDVSLVPLVEALDGAITVVLRDVQSVVENLYIEEKGVKKLRKSQEHIFPAIIVTAKLECMMGYFPGLAAMCQGDIFTYPKSSNVWKKMLAATKFRWLKDKKEIDKSLRLFSMGLTLANAVTYKARQVEQKMGNQTIGAILGALSGLVYTASQDKAQQRAELLFANPTMDSAFKVWNLPDQALVKEVFKLTLPPIEYDKKIYVDRLFPRITKESILKEYESGDQNSITPSDFKAPNLLDQKEELLKTIHNKDLSKVKIRIIASRDITIGGKPPGKIRSRLTQIMNKIQVLDATKNSFKDNFNGVVIHVHGGGFVSMSSSAHRSYLYRWAKSLNMVVFSIDYPLAPAHPYPEALDEIWQAYNWLINYSESILGIPMERIVVAGDSAGGNFVASLTLRAIKEGIRVPDGCFLAYPALNLFPKKVIPSYFVAINNKILPYNVLGLCLKAYIPEEFRADSDPFLSPLAASDELLAKMPAVRMVTGTDDPLHDDNWQFLNRLQKLEKDVEMTVYEGVPHGFLAFDDLVDYELLIAESVGRLRELFYSVEKGASRRKSSVHS